jgi:predicted alpha/beta superfamily hydrolase
MAKNIPPKALYNTKEHIVHVPQLDRKLHLAISLPRSYAKSDQNYPVIYVLDGDYLFGMAAGLTPFFHPDMGVPEVIVVGIGYSPEDFERFSRIRELDFKVPDVINAPEDSHGDRFLAALIQDVVPFIEQTYRADPSERCLYGYSSSGFFVLYAVFHEPAAFRKYVSGSGDLDVAEPYLVPRDSILKEQSRISPVTLYVSVGELENDLLPGFERLTSYIRAADYPAFTLITETHPGEQHGPEGVALSYLHGLRSVFGAPKSES